MAKITEKKSLLTLTEKQIQIHIVSLQIALKAITGKDNLELYIQVRGVPIETLVQTSKEIKTAIDSGMTCDLTNHYVNLEFDNVHSPLNTLNEL